MGRDVFLYSNAIPVIMITIQLDDQYDIIELAKMLQQVLHECERCDCFIEDVESSCE